MKNEPIEKFKFCPNCKKRIKKINNRLLDCLSCGFHFYFSPATTNALILENEKGEILLVKRKYPPKKGLWDLPGGFIELGETLEESVKREIKEELGIEIKNFQYLGSYTGNYLYRDINYQTLCFVFKGNITDQKISPGDDAESFKFFPKTKIPFPQIAFIEVKNGLKDYLKTFSSS